MESPMVNAEDNFPDCQFFCVDLAWRWWTQRGDAMDELEKLIMTREQIKGYRDNPKTGEGFRRTLFSVGDVIPFDPAKHFMLRTEDERLHSDRPLISMSAHG